MKPVDLNKLKALVHYICRTCGDVDKLGSVKLNKILWYSDGKNYLSTSDSITGETYKKLQFGPVATHLNSALDELKHEGLMTVQRDDDEQFSTTKYYAKGDPKSSLFTPDELKIVDDNIKWICGDHSSTSISERSHDSIWDMADMHEVIPYEALLVKKLGTISEEDVAWAKSEFKRIYN
jgi:hypothetical protein